jgi:hypothetical protein
MYRMYRCCIACIDLHPTLSLKAVLHVCIDAGRMCINILPLTQLISPSCLLLCCVCMYQCCSVCASMLVHQRMHSCRFTKGVTLSSRLLPFLPACSLLSLRRTPNCPLTSLPVHFDTHIHTHIPLIVVALISPRPFRTYIYIYTYTVYIYI